MQSDIPSNPALVSQKAGANDVRDFNIARHADASTATSSPAASQTSGVSKLMVGNPELGLQTWTDRSKRGPKQANADTRAWLMQQGVSKSDAANVSDRALQRLRISGPTYRDNKMIRLDVSNTGPGPGKSYKLKINQ